MWAESGSTSHHRCSPAISSIERCRGRTAAALVAAALTVAAASGNASERIALVAALSGPHAALGRDQRDGFQLAVAQQKGRLGGVAVRIVALDDRGEAGRASKMAGRILAEGVRIATGFTTSESALAIHARLQGKNVVMVSSGAVPTALARDECPGDFFSTAPTEDAVHENAGAIARARGYESVYLAAAAASRGPVEAAFRRQFAGRVFGADHDAGAIQRVRQSGADAVYAAIPPTALRSFLQAYDDAGLFHRVPVIVPDSQGLLLRTLGADFAGLTVSTRWSSTLESSADFVAAFERRYGRRPSVYALQGYDAALLLGDAFRAFKRERISARALSAALAKQRPVVQWHAWEVFTDAGGAPFLAPREPTLYLPDEDAPICPPAEAGPPPISHR